MSDPVSPELHNGAVLHQPRVDDQIQAFPVKKSVLLQEYIPAPINLKDLATARTETVDAFLLARSSASAKTRSAGRLTESALTPPTAPDKKPFLDKLNFAQRAEHALETAKTLTFLASKGVPVAEARQVVEVLENECIEQLLQSHASLGQSETPGLILHRMKLALAVPTHNGWVETYKTVRPMDIMARARTLGLHIELGNLERIDQPTVAQLAQLKVITPEQFHSRTHQLAALAPSVFPRASYSYEGNGQFSDLTNFICGRELSPPDEQVFRNAQRLMTIYEANIRGGVAQQLSSTHALSKRNTPQAIIEMGDRIADELVVAEQMIAEIAEKKGIDSVSISADTVSYKCERFARQGTLSTLAEVVRQGGKLGDQVVNYFSGWQSFADELTADEDRIANQASATLAAYKTAQEDPEFASLVFECNRRLSANIGEQRLAVDRGSFYRAIEKRRGYAAQAVQIAREAANLFGQTQEEAAALFDRFLKVSPAYGFYVNPSAILDQAKFNLPHVQLSPDEHIFWKTLVNWKQSPQEFIFAEGESLDQELLSHFFLLNKSSFHQYVTAEGRLTDQFMTDYHQFHEGFSGDIFVQAGHRKNRSVNANAFIFDRQRLPPCLSGYGGIVSELGSMRSVSSATTYERLVSLGTDYDALRKINREGNALPSFEFIEYLLDNEFASAKTATFIKEILLSKPYALPIPAEKLPFIDIWMKVADRSWEFSQHLFAARSQWSEISHNNKLLPSFVHEYLLNTMDEAGGYDVHLLRTEDIESFIDLSLSPPGEIHFWKSLRGIRNEEQLTALRSYADIVSRFDQTGKPTDELLFFLAQKGLKDLQEDCMLTVTSEDEFPWSSPYWESWHDLPVQARSYFNTQLARQSMPVPEKALTTRIQRLKPYLSTFEGFRGASYLSEHIEELEGLLDFAQEPHANRMIIFQYLLANGQVPQAIGNLDEMTKENWKEHLGEGGLRTFLHSLPRSSDEARNAFTHNEYDRTSELVEFFVRNATADFSCRVEDFAVLGNYISRFGMAKSGLLYRYYHQLSLKESGAIQELPEDIQATGVTSTEELIRRYKQLEQNVFSRSMGPQEIRTLSPFEKNLLVTITGKDRHRFDSGRPSFDELADQFVQDTEEGKVQPLPPEYERKNIQLSEIEMAFDRAVAAPLFEPLRDEIVRAIDEPTQTATDQERIQALLAKRLNQAIASPDRTNPKRAVFIEQQITTLQDDMARLESMTSADSLIFFLVDTQVGKADRQEHQSLLRQLLFKKTLERHNSPQFLQDLRASLAGEVSISAMSAVTNVVKNMVKDHVLDISNENKEKYWTPEQFEVLKSKKGRDLFEGLFVGSGKLDDMVKEAQVIEKGESFTVAMTPDRGLMGEMAGYLADVCYTKEYPLLSRWPVVPYLFTAEEGGQTRFVGSVLTFDVKDETGQDCILIRAFDVPDETQFSMPKLIEGFIENISEVAKRRGVKRILIAGTPGTISNYSITTNYVLGTYVSGHPPTPLAEPFAFNGYDITKNCYQVRDLSAEPQHFTPISV